MPANLSCLTRIHRQQHANRKKHLNAKTMNCGLLHLTAFVTPVVLVCKPREKFLSKLETLTVESLRPETDRDQIDTYKRRLARQNKLLKE